MAKLKVYKALKQTWTTQIFGVNEWYYKQWNLKGHNGVDWAVFPCSEEYADTITNKCAPIYYNLNVQSKIADLSFRSDPSFGLGITVYGQSDEGYWQHRWWHFQSLNPELKVGQILEGGELLGWGGSTGISTGPHMHEDHKPLTKRANGTFYHTYSANGFGGAINFMVFYRNDFILDVIENLKKQVTLIGRMIEIVKKIISLQIQIKTK